MKENEEKLVDALMRHCFSCPLKEDSAINFNKECVGYQNEGCKECILRHINDLN